MTGGNDDPAFQIKMTRSGGVPLASIVGRMAFSVVWLSLSVRAAADPAAATVPADAGIAAMVRRLGDPDISVRQKAFQDILELSLEDPARALALLPRSDEDPEIQARCGELRGRIPWERRYRAVAALAGGNAGLAEAARGLFPVATDQGLLSFVSAAGQDRQAAGAMLWERFQEASADERCRILAHFGGLRYVRVAPLLLPFLVDREIGENVGMALGALGAKSVIPCLAEALPEAPDEVRRRIVQVLRRLDDPSAVPHVLPLLQDPSPAVRTVAIDAVATLTRGKAAARIAEMIADGDPGVRAAAVAAVGRASPKDHFSRIADCLDDPDPRVRLQAAYAAGCSGAPQAAERLLPLLDDRSWDVRIVAMESLGRTGNRSAAIPALAALVRNDRSELRIVAAKNLLALAGGDFDENNICQSALDWWEAHKEDPEFALKTTEDGQEASRAPPE